MTTGEKVIATIWVLMALYMAVKAGIEYALYETKWAVFYLALSLGFVASAALIVHGAVTA